MAKISNEKEYKAMMARIEELLPLTCGETYDPDKPESIELAIISDLVADYEKEHFPLEKPSLIGVLKLRMYEMGLSQYKLAELIGVSPSRVSKYLTGKSEPTLKVGREICRKLDISPDIVLGV